MSMLNPAIFTIVMSHPLTDDPLCPHRDAIQNAIGSLTWDNLYLLLDLDKPHIHTLTILVTSTIPVSLRMRPRTLRNKLCHLFNVFCGNKALLLKQITTRILEHHDSTFKNAVMKALIPPNLELDRTGDFKRSNTHVVHYSPEKAEFQSLTAEQEAILAAIPGVTLEGTLVDFNSVQKVTRTCLDQCAFQSASQQIDLFF